MFYNISQIVLVIVLILVAAILHQSVLNTRKQVQPDPKISQLASPTNLWHN